MKDIKKLGVAKFEVSTPGVENSNLILDFNPIVDRLPDKLKKPGYVLFHWQGRPKGSREWGIYDPVADSYRCGVYEDCPVGYGAFAPVMLDDKTATTIPSAVFWISGSLPL